MKRYYQLIVLAIPLLFLLVHIYSVSAASGIAAYYIDPGGTFIVNNLDGHDRLITNTTSNTIFIPVRTLAEQQSFLNNLPADVSVEIVTRLSWPGSTHYDVNCIQIGGSVFDTGSGTICRLSSATVPFGWTQAGNWSTTTIPTSCTCTGGGCCAGTFTATCLVGCTGDCITPSRGHSWSNVAPEEPIMLGVRAGSCACFDCCGCYVYSTITEIGCY